MERRGSQTRSELRGVKKLRRVATGMALAGLIAACGPTPQATETQKPVGTPAETPNSTIVVTPEPTAKPTPEVTQAPTLQPISVLFDSKFEKISKKKFTDTAKELYSQYPELESVYPQEKIDELVKGCQTPSVPRGDQFESCVALIKTEYVMYKQTGNINVLNGSGISYNFTLGLGYDKTNLDNRLGK